MKRNKSEVYKRHQCLCESCEYVRANFADEADKILNELRSVIKKYNSEEYE